MDYDDYLEKITDEANVTKFARERSRKFIYKSVPVGSEQGYLNDKWEVDRNNTNSIRLKKKKKHSVRFENRVWIAFYKMGYKNLNKDNSFGIDYNTNPNIPPRQIDVFCFDDDTAIVIECKSAEVRKAKSLQTYINDFANLKQGISSQLSEYYNPRKKIKYIMATNNIIVSDNDIERLKENDILLFTQDDIGYYELLASHLGEASKYQLFGRIFSGIKIPTLKNKVPAIRGKMGGHTYYSFSVQPEKILKISYILHNTTTSEELASTYQRMVNKKRVEEIGMFLDNEDGNSGFFPNSIILNISDRSKMKFDRLSSEHDVDDCSLGILSCITLT